MRKNNREKLIRSAISTLNKNPLASLDQIAEDAGFSRMTVFRLVKNRKELIKELYIESVQKCQEATAPIILSDLSPRAKIEESVKALVPVGAAFNFLNFEPWRYDDEQVESFYEEYLNGWNALIQSYKETGAMQSDIPIQWVIRSLDALLIAVWDCVDRGDVAANDAARLVIQQFFNGIDNR